jgi:hypothetical protein
MKIDVKRDGLHQIDFDIGQCPVRAVGSYHMIGQNSATYNLFWRSYSFLKGLSEEYPEKIGQVIGNADGGAINVFCAHGSRHDPGWKYKISEDKRGDVIDIMKSMEGSMVIGCCNPRHKKLPPDGPLALYPKGNIVWKETGTYYVPFGDFILNREGSVNNEEYEPMILLLSQGLSEIERDWESITGDLLIL